MKKSLLILPIAVIALGVTTSCNLNSSESDYFKDTTIKEYEKYFQFNDKEYAPLDVGLANYVSMESAANFYKVNKVTNSYCHATRAGSPSDVADSFLDLRTAKELEKNEYVANLVNQKASDVFSASKDEEQKLKMIKTGLSTGFESYELFSNDVIEYVSEDNIYVLNEDNTQTLVDSEKEKDTYWYQLEDGVANVYTQYEGEKYGISVKHHNKYSTLEVESQEEASRELKYYFNNLVIGYARDAISSYGESLNYAYTNNDDIYIVSRMEGKVIESSTNAWIEQYRMYLENQMNIYKKNRNTEAANQIEDIISTITESGVYYVNNPLKPMTIQIMQNCGLDYSKFLSYFLPCIPVSMSVIKISKHNFGWGVDYNAWKSQLLLIKNEKDEVLSSPIAYTSYYDISEVTYKAPSSHVNMVYDEKLEMNNPFNIRLKIWEMMDYGENRNQEEHPDRYVIDEENPFADEIAYSNERANYVNYYNRIYDYTSFYWQAYSDLEENKIRVYSGEIYLDYFRRPAGKFDYITDKESAIHFEPEVIRKDDYYNSYPVFSLEIVDNDEITKGFVGYNDIPASNLGKQNNDYFACPLDTGSDKRIVSNVSQVIGYQVTFYVDADPTHEDTFGQIIDYKYQEGLSISSIGGLRQQEQAIEILPGIND